jgi:hypothetical protein
VIGRMGHFLVMETKSAVQGGALHTESGAWSVWFTASNLQAPCQQNCQQLQSRAGSCKVPSKCLRALVDVL